MYKTLELTLDTERTNNTKTNAQNFLVNTNDYESIKIVADIVQDKERVDLSDATVKLAIRKPDKTIVFQDGTVTAAVEGECEFVLETQSYVLKGTHVAEVMIYFADGKIVVTRAFAYHVAEGILTDTAIESTSWYQDVNELQLAVQELQVEVDAFIDTAVAETRAEITEVDQRLTSQLADIAINASTYPRINGEVNDTPRLQRAIDHVAGLGGGTVYCPKSDYSINSSIQIKSGVKLQGAGFGTRFIIPQNAAFHAIIGDGVVDAVVCDLSIIGGGKTSLGGSYYGVHYNNCNRCHVSNLYVYDIEAIGVKYTDCDYCGIENLFVEYPEPDYIADQVGYAMEFDGCYMCHCKDSYGYRVSFGFLVIGDDTPFGGTNGHESQRTIDFATGCVIDNCHVKYHKGHAFDVNAATGTRITNCTSDKYEGAELFRAAFQNKHSINGSTKNNVFESCVAKNCGTGFYSQQGEKVIFSNCVVENATYHGFWLNSADFCVIANGVVDGYGFSGIRLEGSSGQNIIDNIILFAANSTTTEGIKVINSSSNTFDKVLVRNAHFKAVSIDATSNNNLLNKGVRPQSYAIDDLSTSTIYGLQYQVEIPLTVNGQTVVASPQRGMNVGRVRVVNTTAVTGTTPKVNAGRNGSNGQFVSGQDAPLAVGTINNHKPTNSILNSGQFLVVFTDGVATAGKAVVSIEGLELT